MSTKRPAPPNEGMAGRRRPVDSSDQSGRHRSSGFFTWWYRLAAPPEPVMNATFAQQDLVRRGRLASIILLCMFIITAAFIPLALVSINPLLTPIILALLVLCCIAIVLNRLGQVALAGSLAMIALSLAIVLNLLTSPHGILSTNGLLTYDLLVLPELIAVSILPPRIVFIVALLNSIFMFVDITFQPHAADLEHLLHASTYTILIRPVSLQFVVALVTYLWVRSAVQAIRRAERVEVIAELQRSITQQKQDLEFGVQQIQNTLVQAANGNFHIRTPLAQDNVLWQVAVSLNTLLTRLHRSTQSAQELQRIRMEIGRLVTMLYEAEIKQHPLKTTPTGTLVDPLLQQLSGRYLVHPPSSGDQPSRAKRSPS